MKIINKKTVSIMSLILVLTLVISGALVAVQPAHMETSPFTDVPASHWGFPGILEAYQDNVMTGTSYDPNTGERQFSPAAPLTMAEWTDFDNGGIMSFAEHERIAGYSGINDRDAYKVARALIDAAYPSN